MKTVWSGNGFPLSSGSGEVVEGEQLVVEEGRRSGVGEDVPGADGVDVSPGAFHAVAAFLLAQRVLCLDRQVVHHRVPDRAGELQRVPVVRTEARQRLEVRRTGVVLVEEGRGAVVDGEAGVADRPIGRRGQATRS